MTRLIGSRWKRSNALSRGLLIDRNTILSNFVYFVSVSRRYAAKRRLATARFSNFAGVLPGCDPPDPIPNSAVKAFGPDDTYRLARLGK